MREAASSSASLYAAQGILLHCVLTQRGCRGLPAALSPTSSPVVPHQLLPHHLNLCHPQSLPSGRSVLHPAQHPPGPHPLLPAPAGLPPLFTVAVVPLRAPPPSALDPRPPAFPPLPSPSNTAGSRGVQQVTLYKTQCDRTGSGAAWPRVRTSPVRLRPGQRGDGFAARGPAFLLQSRRAPACGSAQAPGSHGVTARPRTARQDRGQVPISTGTSHATSPGSAHPEPT